MYRVSVLLINDDEHIFDEITYFFLVFHETSKAEKFKKKDKRRKQIRLIGYFQNIIQQSQPSEPLNELLDYLIRRLSSVQPFIRTLSYKTLYLIVTTNTEEYLASLDENNLTLLIEKESPDWLHLKLTKYLKNEHQIKLVSRALIDSLQFETDPILICEYLNFISHHLKFPDEKLVLNCSSLLINRKTISSYILNYSSGINSRNELKVKFLNSIFKIYFSYIDSLLKTNIKLKPNEFLERVFIKFNTVNQSIPIYPIIVYGIIFALSHINNFNTSYSDNLSQLFIANGPPQVYVDFEQKISQVLLPDWLVFKILCSQSNDLINLVLTNVRFERLIPLLSFYGISDVALQKLFQALDKLSAPESRVIKCMQFDRENLLSTLKIYWTNGITYGYKFAKTHLNYKGVDSKDEVVC